MITAESSKEEVGSFVMTNLKLKEEIKNILIKEDISGDVLLDLEEEDFKFIGIKAIPMRKIKAYIEKNKDKFGKKKFTEVISINSDSKEVAEFFSKSLNFNENLNGLNGKSLLELNDESIKNMGLNLGQRKKLVKYINYFKTLKIEPPKENDFVITESSTNEEVIDYLKKKLKFEEKAIKILTEDLGVEGGDSLLLLEESDIDTCELEEEEKKIFKNFINELKSKGKGEDKNKDIIDIVIKKESNKDEVIKYLKFKLNFTEKGIKIIVDDLGVEDGESLLLLEEKDIDEAEELTEEERENIKAFIKEKKEKEESEIKLTKESPIEKNENIENQNIKNDVEDKKDLNSQDNIFPKQQQQMEYLNKEKKKDANKSEIPNQNQENNRLRNANQNIIFIITNAIYFFLIIFSF